MIQESLLEKIRSFTTPDELKSAGIYPYFRAIEKNNDTEVMIGGNKVLMFGIKCIHSKAIKLTGSISLFSFIVNVSVTT